MQRGEGVEVLTVDFKEIEQHIRRVPINEDTVTYTVIFDDCGPTEAIIAAMLESHGAKTFSDVEALFQRSIKKWQIKVRFNR